MDYAFAELGFETLVFSNALGNLPSRRIKEKTGARLIGTRSAKFVDPNYLQAETWELGKAEWQACKLGSEVARNLAIVRDKSADVFLKEAGTLLYKSEASNSLIIGLAENQVGPAAEAESFAKIWGELKKVDYSAGMGQKIYVLEKVIWPTRAEGVFRKADAAKTDVLTRWMVEFGNESLPPKEKRTLIERKPYVERALQKGYAHVWDVNGSIVSMAFAGCPTRNSRNF